MKSVLSKTLAISIIALLIFSTLAVFPAFSGFPVRYYAPGIGLGTAAIYVDPQDSLFTSTKPIDLREGEYFTVEVRIANASKIAGWQVELTFNKNYLSTVAANVTYAPDMIFPGGSYSPVPSSVASYNATHDYALMTASTTGAVEYAAADAGLMVIKFRIEDDPDGPSGVLSSMLYVQVEGGIFGSWTTDSGLSFDNELYIHDGYYENAYVPPPPAYLEVDPAVTKMPVIEGDRIVGTSDALFSVDILINDVDPADELFLVQFEITYRSDLIEGIWIDEGTFMSNPAWAPDGTINNGTVFDVVDPTHTKMIDWIMIAPNASGVWPSLVWPSGDGLLATARFEVIGQGEDSDGIAPEELLATSELDVEGVFGECFLGHPNDPDPSWLPYSGPIDGQVDIYGYYWKAPTAVKTHTPTTPIVDEIVTFDGTSSTAYENVDGAMVPNPALIDTYFWDFGDGENDTGAIVTHSYTAMGDYTVSLTVTDVDGKIGTTSQVVTVIFGRLIDVFVGQDGVPYPDPYGGQGPNKVADMFEPQKTVSAWALVTYNGDPVQSKLVTFIVLSPSGLHDFSRTGTTNETGYAFIEFGLPWPCEDPEEEIFGIWNITVKVDIRSVVVEDVVFFKVWWLVEITSVVPKATAFVKGGVAGFDIYYRTYRMQPVDAVVEITVYDDLMVPIGSVRVKLEGLGWGNYTWCIFKEYEVQLEIEIPKWAFVGTGTVYANIFHFDPTNPYGMGAPMCPEASATFDIDAAP